MKGEWKLIWREIGWINPNTIRQGWAIQCIYDSETTDTYCWIENDKLAICDPISYYPGGCYNLPLEMLERLKEKSK